MKKIFIILLFIVTMFPNTAFADDAALLEEKMKGIFISPEDEAALEVMRKQAQEEIDEKYEYYSEMPEYYRKKISLPLDNDELKEYFDDVYGVYEDKIIKIYITEFDDFAKQYADSGAVRYLISDDYFLVQDYKSHFRRNESDGSPRQTYESGEPYFRATATESVIDYLHNTEAVLDTLEGIDISSIKDIRVIGGAQICSCLYVDCGTEEYLIGLFLGSDYSKFSDSEYCQLLSDIEDHKLYTAKEFVQRLVGTGVADEQEIKPTYEPEADSLVSDGLLYGTENGLDLLKPLTRIEATAMLVRAMGLEDEQTSETSYFSDIPNDNWGARYANIAKDRGIAAGVGDDLFAPNERITSSQFAALLLRNAGENPDWQTAIEELVEKGYITQEQSEYMTLFTRGDMAKIIYEAKQNGIL